MSRAGGLLVRGCVFGSSVVFMKSFGFHSGAQVPRRRDVLNRRTAWAPVGRSSLGLWPSPGVREECGKVSVLLRGKVPLQVRVSKGQVLWPPEALPFICFPNHPFFESFSPPVNNINAPMPAAARAAKPNTGCERTTCEATVATAMVAAPWALADAIFFKA